ncbi:reverse transcriptase domain-containing protein [Tanacetum coccineum]
MKCQPLNFKGTKGVLGLSRWFEKMELVFHISGCAIDKKVKFDTCTLLGAALTWWNGHLRTLGHDAAYAMTWEILKKKLTDKYCPKGEIKKLEIELWNLKVKGNDVGGYTQRFQELALLPKTLDDAIELANDLMDKKLHTYAERQTENKKKLNDNNQAQQQLLKKQNVVQAYAVRSGEKKPYGGSKPLCPKCNYHHDGECAPRSDCPVLKNQDLYVTLLEEVNIILQVLIKVGAVAYKLELPQELSRVHNTFHVSNLKKCYSDEPLVIPLDGLHIDDKPRFMEEPIEIMDREVKQLKQSRIPIVKVRWNFRRGLEFTWEREDQFQKKYPHLFTKSVPSSSVVT